MTFPNPNFDHESLAVQVGRVVDSHDKRENPKSLDKETRDLRSATEGGININPHEIPYLQQMIIERARALESEIEKLQSAIDNYAVANLDEAEDRLRKLTRENIYLRENFAEKFFKNPDEIGKE
jgi:hypothetical protein